MRSKSLHAFVTLSLAALAGSACTKDADRYIQKQPPPEQAAMPAVNTKLVERGAYLVGVGGCNDCHTPMKFDPAIGMPVPQMDRKLSGHPEGAPEPAGAPGKTDQAVIGATFTSFKLPFGVVYAANLTPDEETGLGLWTEEDFTRAMRTGRHRGAESGRPILPPMPWMNVAGASDDDLKAIFAYLKSVPAVRNRIPEPSVPPPVFTGIADSYAKVLSAHRSRPASTNQPL